MTNIDMTEMRKAEAKRALRAARSHLERAAAESDPDARAAYCVLASREWARAQTSTVAIVEDVAKLRPFGQSHVQADDLATAATLTRLLADAWLQICETAGGEA